MCTGVEDCSRSGESIIRKEVVHILGSEEFIGIAQMKRKWLGRREKET